MPPNKPDYQQIANEITKPAFKNYPTRQVISNYPNEIWSVDLVELSKISDDNDNYKYLLCIVDVFTRFAWVIPHKNKSEKDVLDGFKKAVKDNKNVYPTYIWSDLGKEFKNKAMSKWCSDNDIKQYSTYGNSKSAIVERFNRTMKNIM